MPHPREVLVRRPAGLEPIPISALNCPDAAEEAPPLRNHG